MVRRQIQFSEQMNSTPNELANSEDFEFQALGEAKNYRAALLREFGPYLQGNVVEVGAGIGQMTAELRGLVSIKKLCSIEPDAGFCTRIRASFPDHALVQGTIADLQEQTEWNAILSVNVLEHIESDAAELASYFRLLEPSEGTLCLFVPARPEIYAPIDRDFGHFRRYTRPDLRNKLERAGFTVHRLRYYNLLGYFAWWMNFCLMKKRSFQKQAVRFFDRAIFPPVHWTETQISAPPVGQSLLAIAEARRPSGIS
jgi:SAM-dependent methyltransferase